jgi:osmotically-inducible protein OsmY
MKNMNNSSFNPLTKSRGSLHQGLFAAVFLTVSMAAADAGNTNWPQPVSTDERNQLAEMKGPEIYNAPAYEKMEQEIADAIMNDPDLSDQSRHIDVSVADGVVVLKGDVSSAKEEERILQYSKESAGMARVSNQLQIKSSE